MNTLPTYCAVCQSLNFLPDLSPKNPVVFCHGLLGFDSVTIGPAIAPLEVTHWRGIKEVLQSNGVDVLITRVPATSSPIDRAQVLVKRISEVYPGKKIHLIGLSFPIPYCDGLCIYTQGLVWHAGHSMVSFHLPMPRLSGLNNSLGWFGLSIPHNPLGRQKLFCSVSDNRRDTPPRLRICGLLSRDDWSDPTPTGSLSARHAAERGRGWQGLRVPYDGEHEEV